MSRGVQSLRDEPVIIELDGPPMAYFEIPLDYWATPNGELEAESHPEASRLVQRVAYMNFKVTTQENGKQAIERVRARLKELGGGYIWWRMRPRNAEGWTRFRLGTTPELPFEWWKSLFAAVDNRSSEHAHMRSGAIDG